jgi:potassium-dependent mechanosensitive channel
MSFKNLILATLLFALPAISIAQDSKSDSIEVETYPLLKIGDLSFELNKTLEKLLKDSEVIGAISTMNEKVSRISPELDSLIILTNYLLEYEIEQFKINDAKNKWNRFKKEVENIRSDIESYSDILDKDLVILKEHLTQWERTRDLPREDSIPEIIIGKIDTSLIKINQAHNQLNDSLLLLIGFGDEVQKINTLISENQLKLIAFQENYLREIFTKTTVPIWKNLPESDSTLANYQIAQKIVLNNVRDTWIYSKQNWNNFIWLLVIALILRFMVHNSSQKEGLTKSGTLSFKGSASISKNPWSSSFIVSLIITNLYLLSNAPELLVSILFLSLLIFSLPARNSFFHQRFLRILPLGLMVIFSLSLVVQLWVIDPYSKRIWVFFLSIFSIAWLVYIYWESKKETEHFSSWIRWILGFLFIGLCLSVFLNIIGYMRLTLYLHRALITSFFVIYILIIITGIIEGFIQIILKSPLLKESHILLEYRNTIRKWLFSLVTLVALFLGTKAILSLAGIYELSIIALGEFIEKDWAVGTSKLSIQSVLLFFSIIIGTVFIANILKVLLEKELLIRLNLKKGIPMATGLVVKYILSVIGFFFAIGATGINLDKIGFIAGALGVGIGFGLQNIVANFISGLLLVFERPINKGDIITVNQQIGKVLEIGIRASKIKTFSGAEVVVPNNDLVAKEVINWTLSDSDRRVELKIPVAFENNPEEVAEVIINSLTPLEEILDTPAPQALFVGYENGVLNFKVLIWTEGNIFLAESKGGIAIFSGLAKQGIKVAKPNFNIGISERDKKDISAK